MKSSLGVSNPLTTSLFLSLFHHQAAISNSCCPRGKPDGCHPGGPQLNKAQAPGLSHCIHTQITDDKKNMRAGWGGEGGKKSKIQYCWRRRESERSQWVQKENIFVPKNKQHSFTKWLKVRGLFTTSHLPVKIRLRNKWGGGGRWVQPEVERSVMDG